MTEEEKAQQAEISRRLQEIMRKRDVTIEALAKRLGFPPTTTRQLVERPLEHSVFHIQMLCDVLNIKFTGGAGGPKVEDLEK